MPKRWMKIVFGPIVREQFAHRAVEAHDDRAHADDCRDADDDAEHGQPGAHLVGAHRVERHHDDFLEQIEPGSGHGCSRYSLLEGFDRIELRGARGRGQPEEESDEGRDSDAQRDGPGLDRGRNRRGFRDDEGDGRGRVAVVARGRTRRRRPRSVGPAFRVRVRQRRRGRRRRRRILRFRHRGANRHLRAS